MVVHPNQSTWARYKPQLGDADAPPVELLPVLGYGNSYLLGTAENTTGARWIDRVKARLNLGTLTVRAINGSSIHDMSRAVIGTVNTPLVNGSGIVFLGGVGIVEQLNALELSQDDILAEGIRDTLDAIMKAASGILRAESSLGSVVASGTWTASSNTLFSGGSYRFSSVPGDYLEYTIGAGMGGTYDYFIPAVDTSTYGRLEMIVSVNGVEVTRVAPEMRAAMDDSAATSSHFAGSVDVEDGDLLRFTVGNRVAGPDVLSSVGLDFISLRSLNPPLIAVIDEPNMNFMPEGEYEVLRGLIHEVVDQYDHAMLIDVSPGFDLARMISDDNLHLNDYGHSHYANHIETALRQVPFRHGMNQFTQSTF